MSTYDGKGEVTFTVNRDGENIELSLTPVYDEESQRYLIGIMTPEREIVNINFFNCFKYGFNYLVNVTKITLVALFGIFRGVGLDNLSGPIGVYQATSQAVEMGALTYINLMAVLSVNIGLMNALPLPILDGGRIVIVLLETIIRRPISKKVQEAIMSASSILLFILVIFVTFKDIIKLF